LPFLMEFRFPNPWGDVANKREITIRWRRYSHRRRLCGVCVGHALMVIGPCRRDNHGLYEASLASGKSRSACDAMMRLAVAEDRRLRTEKEKATAEYLAE